MPDLEIFDDGEALYVDSRLIAERLGIEHESFLRTLDTYQSQMEQAFGVSRFEIGKPLSPQGGRPQRYALLNEEQASFLMSLSRNTPEVIQCKVDLIKAFSKAKEVIRQRQAQAAPPPLHTTIYIKRLENMRDHRVDDSLWTTFREGAEVLLLVEKDYKVPVEQLDLCDGSIGSHWSQYRQMHSWAKPVGSYVHVFQDQRGEREPRAYDVTELPYFKAWLREHYVPIHLPKYLVDKYGKRAVRQIYEEISLISDHVLELTAEKRSTPKQEQLYQDFLVARADLLRLPGY
jgi:phage regulator Rha-like protein